MKWFNGMGLTKKLLLCFALFTIIPIMLYSFFIQATAKKNIMQFAYDSSQNSIDLIDHYIDRQFRDYKNLSYFMSRDKQLRQLEQLENPDDVLVKNLSTLLRGYRLSVPNVELAGVAFNDGRAFTSAYSGVQTTDFVNSRIYQECLSGVKKIYLESFPPHQTPFEDMNTTLVETIMIAHPITNEAQKVIGVSFVMVQNNVLEKSISNVLGRRGSYIYILSGDNKIVYSPFVQQIPSMSNEEEFIQVSKKNPEMGWTIIGNIRIADAINQIDALNSSFYLVLSINVVFMIAGAALISRMVIRPVSRLRTLMQRVEQGDLSVRYNVRGKDEINNLGASFNVMVQKLSLLMEQIYVEQKAKRKAEMEALQANIKPHFLYNTLDTISWMARRYNARDIVQTVDALSDLFRISLSKGSENILLKDEITHIASYLKIQQTRYEDMVSSNITTVGDCMELYVQKLILQPLVENAIYHGLKETDEGGTIEIRIRKTEKAIHLLVRDNGVGMSSQRLKEVSARLQGNGERSDVYGIANVQERIVLNYGKKYGLRIWSAENKGTIVAIRHPIIQSVGDS